MLRSLEIRDVLIIDRLDLTFQPGLNVLTGETGAGKSILLDALGFVLGWRGRADLVRMGADQGEVTAVFDLPQDHAARAVLEAAGLEPADELILRRINSADGRKTAYINDRRASGEVLRDLSDTLVELHGQHDDRGLLNPRGHRQLLDSFAALDLSGLRAAWRARADALRDLSLAETALAAIRAEEDFLRHAVAELNKLDPKAGEEAALDTQRADPCKGHRASVKTSPARIRCWGRGPTPPCKTRSAGWQACLTRPKAGLMRRLPRWNGRSSNWPKRNQVSKPALMLWILTSLPLSVWKNASSPSAPLPASTAFCPMIWAPMPMCCAQGWKRWMAVSVV